jgi:hypothetical protein
MKEGVATVTSRLNKRYSVGHGSVVSDTAPNSSSIANIRERRYTESGTMIRHRYIKIKDYTKIACGRYVRYTEEACSTG